MNLVEKALYKWIIIIIIIIIIMLLQRRHFLLTHFKDFECWSGRDLNLRPPGAYPIELTGRRVENKDLSFKFTFYYLGSHICHREELAIRFVCLTSMMTFIVTAVFSLVTQGSLRDETENGCVSDYKNRRPLLISTGHCTGLINTIT